MMSALIMFWLCEVPDCQLSSFITLIITGCWQSQPNVHDFDTNQVPSPNNPE